MQAKDIAISTFSKLDKRTNRDGNYLHMQIYINDNVRSYICLSPILSKHAIIHHEYDGNAKLDYTEILPCKRVLSYINDLDSITYVGLCVSQNPDDDMTCLYKA